MFDRKTKIILGSIAFISIGAVVAKGLYDYTTYKILKGIEKNFKKNSWDYYD